MAKRGGKKPAPTLEEEQRALTEAVEVPTSDGARVAIAAALASKRSLVAARAANLIKRHRLEGFSEALRETFTRFLDNPVKNDPSCTAKLAAIEALDFTESSDPDPFLRAARHVQLEPAWGPPVDTAVGLRQRGIVALARLHHSELDLLAAELLTDTESPVRQAALDALAHRGTREGAALALFKLRLGDEDPLVTLAAMSALVALAPDRALPELIPLVEHTADARRELACVALGQSRRDDALAPLLEALSRCVRAEEREPILRGLGLHRSEGALAALLEVVADGALTDAEAAIAALAVRRFEPTIEKQVREAAKRNSSDLEKALHEAFTQT